MRASPGSQLVLLVLGVVAATGTARAQTSDFATCPATLSACSTSNANCCTKPFAAASTGRAIVIPMDRCHQQVAGSGVEAPPGSGAPRLSDGSPNFGHGWCVSPSGTADDGVFHTYGLVYRLMQHDIPVYWIVNPTKNPLALTQYQSASSQEYIASDVDAWVLSAGASVPSSSTPLSSCGVLCAPPVRRVSPTTLDPINNSYAAMQFPMRGGAFVIAPEDRPRFDQFWLRQGPYAGLDPTKYDFSAVDLYELDTNARFAYQNFQAGTVIDGSAPVAAVVNYDAPRIARLGTVSSVATSWLAKAKLDHPATNTSCTSGAFVPSDAVYCNVSDAQVQSGALITGGFGWAWIDKYTDNSPCGDTAERTMFEKLGEFMTAVPGTRSAGNVFAMESSIEVAERCAGRQLMGATTGGIGLLADNTAINETAARPYIYRYPNNLFLQWGDVPLDFQSGAITNWRYAGAGVGGYRTELTAAGSTLKRLVTYENSASGSNPTCSRHRSTTSCDKFTASTDTSGDVVDMAAYARYQNVGINGLIFYIGGNQIQNNTGHLRIVLNSVIATPLATVGQEGQITEVSRASPVVATIGNTTALVQGTYEKVLPAPSIPIMAASSDAATFRFPYLKGHMRAVDANNVTTAGTAFEDQTAIFDAATGIPPVSYTGCSSAYQGNCRTVFTTVAAGFRPASVQVSTSNVGTLGPIMGDNLTVAARTTLIQRVLAGHEVTPGVFEPRLGGVDRSTVAVIPQSNVAGTIRPTMAYFAAADGMLHAVCASVQGACTALGKELWAYIPRTMLPLLRYNAAQLNGSPRVMDLFGDFDNDGRREFKTILLFQTGGGDATATTRVPAVYALDITDPTAPQVLWDYAMTSVTARSDYELGQGLVVAAGRVKVGSADRLLAFAQGNNLGTAGAGSVTVAIDIESGAQVWKQGITYPAPRSTSNPPVPLTGIPGGAVAVDKQGNGYVTDIVFGTLYGSVYQLDAATGVNRHGTNPLFRFTTDFHPIGVTPAVYSNGNIQYAVVASGGYADPLDSSWDADPQQYAIAVSLSTPVANAPLTENSGNPYVPFKFAFANGERAYAQALVVGNEIFITTDSGDVNSASYGTTGNSTGKAYRISFTGASTGTSTSLAGGASSAVNAGTAIYTGSSDTSQRLGNAASTAGTAVDGLQGARASRKLWLRTL